MIVYFNGQYLPQKEVVISPDDRGFLFADGLYEVVLYEKGKPFHLQRHLLRLNNGAYHLRFSSTDFCWLEEVVQELLRRNNLEGADATIYIQVTRGVAPRLHAFPAPETPLTVYAIARPFDSTEARAARKNGVFAITVADQRWARCDLKTIALTANVLANQEAAKAGAKEAIFVKDGVLIEGSHSNFAGVCNGELVTYPACNNILSGITRDVTLLLAASLGIPVALRPIFQKDLSQYDELMMLATTAKVTPIVKLDDTMIGAGVPGPVVRRLQEGFRSLTGDE